MTHQRLMEKAKSLQDASLWLSHNYNDNQYEKFLDACQEWRREASPETILALLAELDAARKDAERWKVVRDNRGPGLRLITWDPKAHEELQVMFPSQKICDEYADAAIDAALNADGKKTHER